MRGFRGLFKKKNYNSADDAFGVLIRAIQAATGNAKVVAGDIESQLRAYTGTVHACVNLTATAVGNVKLHLYVKKKDGGKSYKNTKQVDDETFRYLKKQPSLEMFLGDLSQSVEVEEVTSHRFLDLIRGVNGFTNEFTLKEITSIHLDLAGNCYWQIIYDKAGLPTEIRILNPAYMKIKTNGDGTLAGYEYKRGKT